MVNLSGSSKAELEKLVFQINSNLTTNIAKMYNGENIDPFVQRVFIKIFDVLADILIKPLLSQYVMGNSVILINTIQAQTILIENSDEYRKLFSTKNKGPMVFEALK